MGHWYDEDGNPRHTVIIRTGQNKGLPRDTTLRDARQHNWFPSFSEVWGILAAPPLEQWKRKQLLLAASAISRDPFDGDQAWMDEVLKLYEINTTKARDLGSKLHAEIEKSLKDTVWMSGPEAHAGIQALGEWCGLDSLHIEKSFADPLGFGGTCDVHKRTDNGWVADFKTKDFVEDDLPDVWPNHFAQLAAYREGLGLPNARCAIIYVSTVTPGLTHTVEIDEDDLAHGWNLFVHCLRLWQEKNKYWPCFSI